MMKSKSPLALVLPFVLGLLFGACKGEQITETQLVLRGAGGRKRADVNEVMRVGVRGTLLQQRITLVDVNDAVMSLSELDTRGFANGASYRREGKHGKRYVELKRVEDNGVAHAVVFSRGDDETLALPDRPVVVLSTFGHLTALPPNTDVTVLDIENAAFVAGHVDAAGHLNVSPPSSLAEPVLPVHTARAPFLESAAPMIVSWCKQQAAHDMPAVAAARALALAVKPKLAPDRAGGPPSAFWTWKIGANDEGGAALTVACLRALGHPARVVTGDVAGTGARTWAQVHDGARWVDVDPLDIDVDGVQHAAHTARVEGFPGPLTTGPLAAGTPAP